MKAPVIVMDFSGIYDFEPFAQDKDCHRIDCRNLNGTDCYCDHDAAVCLKEKIAHYPIHGIHFIDSGNYHYITKFWAERIHHPFSLIVFDHHPDMQPSAFDNLLSCGNWVKAVIDTNPYLQKVILIGAEDALVHAVPKSYRNKVVFYTETSLQNEETWNNFTAIHLKEPVYVSIDKDVLNTHDAATNWSQGSLSLSELKNLLGVVLKNEKIIGIDICGESAPTSDIVEEETEAELNNETNESILDFVLRTEQQQTA